VLGPRLGHLPQAVEQPVARLLPHPGNRRPAEAEKDAEVDLVADRLAASPLEAELGDRGHPGAGQLDRLGQRDALGRNVLGHQIANDREHERVLKLQQLQPIGNRQVLDSLHASQELGGQALHFFVRALQQATDASQRKRAQRGFVLPTEKSNRPDANRSTAGGLQQGQQVIEAPSPDVGIKLPGVSSESALPGTRRAPRGQRWMTAEPQ
jgi:hypothetical protein